MAELDETIQQLKFAYDTVAYESRPHRQTHPDRLSMEAALRGIRTPPVDKCRVLEIGCASGGNLIPIAEQLPKSQFLGLDLSGAQIEAGLDVVREMELKNIELRCQDLMEFPKDAGTFDYIIAHGFYAWVPRPVQQRLLEVSRDHLSPTGVVYISYTTYPGLRQVEAGRDMMLFHARHTTDPMQRVARGREILRFMTEQTPDTHTYREVLRNLLKTLSLLPDRHIMHDHMAAAYDPQYFWSFMDQAKAHGLGYVGDVGNYQNPWFTISPAVRNMIHNMSSDTIEREQYLDFLIHRQFRCSILCREAALPPTEPPAAERLEPLYVAGNPSETPAGTNAQGLAVFEFTAGQAKIHISNPHAIAVLREIRAAWPRTIPFPELRAWAAKQGPGGIAPSGAVEDLARVIETYARMGLVELWTRSNHFIAAEPGIRPRAGRYARWQATHDNLATTLRHESIVLDAGFRQLLPMLDGTRDKIALAQELIRRKEADIGGSWPAKNLEHLGQMVEATLRIMASSSLILGEKDGN